MSELQHLSDKISHLNKLVVNLANPIPFEKALWDKPKLADYFNCSVDTLDRMIKKHSSFPKGRRRNVDSDKGCLLWRAAEVTNWADEYIFE